MLSDESWKVDLEIALLEDADYFRIRSICQNRPLPPNCRAEVWRICLKPELQTHNLTDFDAVLHLPNQQELHADCNVAAKNAVQFLSSQPQMEPILDSPASSDAECEHVELSTETLDTTHLPTVDELTDQFESVLTHFIHSYSLSYNSNDGWTDVLRILYQILRPSDSRNLYACFSAVHHRFIPTGANVVNTVSNLFRLLIQYHAPHLCNFLDSVKLNPDSYIITWLLGLFTRAGLAEDVLMCMWDIYFLCADPILGIFIALVLLINEQSTLVGESVDQDEKVGEECARLANKMSRTDVLEYVLNLPKPMQSTDLSALIDLTQLFSNCTPAGYRSQCLSLLFGNHLPGPASESLALGMCLTVSVQEVLGSQANAFKEDKSSDADNPVRFLIADCRPAPQYNAGHLNTAFFLDTEMILSNPSHLDQSIKVLLQSQQRALEAGSHAAGEHITVLGSGRVDEDHTLNLIVAAFLRMNVPHVSILEGGYVALHEALGPEGLRKKLSNHNEHDCLCCQTSKHQQSQSTPNTQEISRKPSLNLNHLGTNLFSKMTKNLFRASSFASKSENVDADSSNPPAPRESTNPIKQDSSFSKAVSYRNTSSVFTIDDDEEDDDEISDIIPPKNETNTQILKPPERTRFNRFFQRQSVSPEPQRGDLPTRPGGLDSSQPGDWIDTTEWSCRPEVQSVFDCQLIDVTGRLTDSGILVLAERHVLLLRFRKTATNPLLNSLSSAIYSMWTSRSADLAKANSPPQKSAMNYAEVLRSVPLALITRITANRRIPECITFHYSTTDPSDQLRLNEQVMGVRDRLYISEAGEAVRRIKMAIYNATMSC